MSATKLTRYVQQCKIQPIMLLMIVLTDIFYLSYVFVYNNNVQSNELYDSRPTYEMVYKVGSLFGLGSTK